LLVLLVVWLRTPTATLREQLKSLQFWSLEVCLVLAVGLGSLIVRDLVRQLNRRDAIRIGVLAACATVLTLSVAPRTNRIYYDEQIYQAIAQNLADLKLAQMCNDGTVEYGRLQCWNGEYNKQPYAYPHLLSILYRAFGVAESRAFAFNALVAGLTVVGVYLLVVSLFADRTAALFGGLIIALTPHQLLWSATAAVEPSASLACVAALLCASAFCNSRSTSALAGTAAVTAYAIQFRPESVIILPVVGMLLWRSSGEGELRRPRLWGVGLLSLVLVAVHIAHMVAVRNEGWGTTDARLSLGYVFHNLRVNGRFYFADERFPVAFTLLAAVGLAGAGFSAQRRSIGLYFLGFFGIYLLFYAGSYNYGADVRYSVMTYPPIAVLAGLGASAIVTRLQRRKPGSHAIRLVIACLVFQFLWYAPVVRATTEEAWAARADVRFARSLVASLPPNAYVLTHNPGMFHLWGVNAGQMSLVVTNPRHFDFLALRYGGGVYLHWNFWCNVQDPIQPEFCRKALEGRAADVVREYRERDQRFSVYRFRMP
jgi:Dolichyl-phosphate-mannose-protein mannosyltransferase